MLLHDFLHVTFEFEVFCFSVIDRAWYSRRLAYSNEVIAFALPGSEKLIDAIPLAEIKKSFYFQVSVL